MNQNPTQWERQIAGARAYASLSDADKAALDGLDKADRNALHYGWQVPNAERRALGGVPLVQLKELIHEARPDVVVELKFRQDGSVQMNVLRADGEAVKITGFDHLGEVGADGLNAVMVAGGQETTGQTYEAGHLATLATEIAKTLPAAPPPGKYAAPIPTTDAPAPPTPAIPPEPDQEG